jgi:hypothetical protein
MNRSIAHMSKLLGNIVVTQYVAPGVYEEGKVTVVGYDTPLVGSEASWLGLVQDLPKIRQFVQANPGWSRGTILLAQQHTLAQGMERQHMSVLECLRGVVREPELLRMSAYPCMWGTSHQGTQYMVNCEGQNTGVFYQEDFMAWKHQAKYRTDFRLRVCKTGCDPMSSPVMYEASSWLSCMLMAGQKQTFEDMLPGYGVYVRKLLPADRLHAMEPETIAEAVKALVTCTGPPVFGTMFRVEDRSHATGWHSVGWKAQYRGAGRVVLGRTLSAPVPMTVGVADEYQRDLEQAGPDLNAVEQLGVLMNVLDGHVVGLSCGELARSPSKARPETLHHMEWLEDEGYTTLMGFLAGDQTHASPGPLFVLSTVEGRSHFDFLMRYPPYDGGNPGIEGVLWVDRALFGSRVIVVRLGEDNRLRVSRCGCGYLCGLDPFLVFQVRGLPDGKVLEAVIRGQGDLGLLLVRSDHGWHVYSVVRIDLCAPALSGLLMADVAPGELVPFSGLPSVLRGHPDVGLLHLPVASSKSTLVFVL